MSEENEGKSWTGKNLDAARQLAARELVTYIKANRKLGEPITIVGHSHGGNVAIMAANMLAEDPELADVSINLFNMNTPAREYQLSEIAKKQLNTIMFIILRMLFKPLVEIIQ